MKKYFLERKNILENTSNRKSKKNWQHNDQKKKDKMTNNDLKKTYT